MVRNITLAMEPRENLGLYWYLLSEMFWERISFFRYSLVLMQVAMCGFVSLMIYQLFDVLDWVAEGRDFRKIDPARA